MLLELLLAALIAAPSSVVLRWKAVEGATLYDLEIASDPQFRDVVLAVRIATNGYRWEAAPEKPHYFRARGLDVEDRAGPWSESKEIAAVFVAPPLTKPPRGSSMTLDPNGTKIEFEFDSSPLFTSYRLEVATDEKFTNVVFDKTEPVAPITFITKSAGTYYYRLTAQSEGGKQTAPGAVGNFFIQLPGPESLGADGVEVRVGGETELAWKTCKACIVYRVQVSADPKWKTLLVDERLKGQKYVYKPTAPGKVAWRVMGEDVGGKRSTPSAVKAIIVLEGASEPVVVKKEPEPHPPPPDTGPHFYYGLGHSLHWNFATTAAAFARIEGGVGFALGPGRFLAFLTGGFEYMDPSAEFPAANVRPTLLVFPATLALGYQFAVKDFRIRLAAFPAINPAFIVLTGPTSVMRTAGFGFGIGGHLAVGYKLGPMQAFVDLRVSWAPLVTSTLRVQTGGLMVGFGIWYEP